MIISVYSIILPVANEPGTISNCPFRQHAIYLVQYLIVLSDDMQYILETTKKSPNGNMVRH